VSFEDASFGKINLKNLKKLQKLDLSGDDFVRASGLQKSDKINFLIHDQISHKAIPQYVGKYVDNFDKTAYTSAARKEKFLPLANPNNQLKKSRILKDDDLKQQYNSGIERLADSVEGRFRNTPILGGIGKALRKKKLTKAEQIATNMAGSPVVGRLLKNPNKPVTQLDVSDLIREARRDNRNTKPQSKKVKGIKEPEKTIEEKKYYLNMRRLDRKMYGN
jgi:hypothetical protein